MLCPTCGSANLRSRGYHPNGKRRYKCMNCGKMCCDKEPTPEYLNGMIQRNNEKKSKIDKKVRKIENKSQNAEQNKQKTSNLTQVVGDLTAEQRKAIVLYAINIKLPINELATHLNCSEKVIKQYVDFYKKSVKNGKLSKMSKSKSNTKR